MSIYQTTLDGGQTSMSMPPAQSLWNGAAKKYHLHRGPVGKRCKQCAKFTRKKLDSGSIYFKCADIGNTSGPGTDIRANWEACERFVEAQP